MFDDSIRNLLGFHETILYKEYNQSNNHVNIPSFDKIFLECVIAKGMIYKQKPNGTIHNWTMTVNPGYTYVKSYAEGFTWYMMETKDIISSISFKLKIENNELVSFNGQNILFRLSIKDF